MWAEQRSKVWVDTDILVKLARVDDLGVPHPRAGSSIVFLYHCVNDFGGQASRR